MAKVIPSKVSPFSKPFAKETLAVVPTLQIILVFNPVTKFSTYVLVAASEPALGEPNPVIVPPVIAILLDACVATEPRPKEVLAVAPDSATKLEPSPTIKLPSVFAALMSPNPDPQVSIAEIGNYSAVYEFSPSKDGSYVLSEDGTYGPSEPSWIYTSPDKYSMYSAFISGAQRLKNGNTLITSGARGRFIEVTSDNDIVWEYWNPYNYNYKLPDGSRAQPADGGDPQ